MLNEKIIELGKNSSEIRELSEYGDKRKAEIGPKRFLILVSEAPMFLVRTELHRII